MRRREFIAALAAAAAWPVAAYAQQTGKVHRIGFLRVGRPPTPWTDGLWQGLGALGYVEGRNITIEFALAARVEEIPALAAKLVHQNVDVLLASGTPSIGPAKAAAGKIPMVFVAAIDPVAIGLVGSLSRPGGNVTGVTAMQADITGKRLQLLRELLPGLSTIAVLVRVASQANTLYVKETEAAARALGLQLQVLTLRDPRELEEVVASARGMGALIVADDALFTANRVRIAEAALKNRLPTACGFGDMVEAGGLMAYGPHYGDLYRRAAMQVHKILHGAKPADLPIEQPTKFELVVNGKTAKVLGLKVPESFLLQADQVID
jgi:putative ABC transport system substrate-binding protein